MAERHGFHEAHFTSLPCQSNVYGLTSLMYPGGIGKVLVAPLKDKVVSLEYMTDQERGKLKPVAKEIHFAGIPDDAEIISIDSYKRLKKDGGHIIGITFTKDAQTENPTHNLNIYAPWEKGSEYVLENIAQTWTNIELDFTPFFLCHTEIMEDGKREMVFLLTGSDKQIHMYRDTVQTWNEVGSRFSEHPIGGSFPEFADLPCVALWLDCRTLGDRKRVSVVGCRSGYIRLSIVDTKSNEIVKQWETHHDSAITCCRLFTRTTHVESASSWLQRRQERILDDERGPHSQEEGNRDYSLLVTSALEVAAVYGNVLQDGFQHQSILPQSDVFDCALCTSVADLDWDGYNELLVGTYGQVLLVYKYISNQEAGSQVIQSDSFEKEPDSKDDLPEEAASSTSGGEGGSGKEGEEGGGGGGGGGGSGKGGAGEGHYELLWSRSFAHPLLALNHFDLTGDGLQEIVVLSTRGLHILQHNLEKAAQVCLEGLRQLLPEEPT